MGEAHFFKAWFYFNLVLKYGDVPWYSHALYPDSEGLMDARTPRTTVIDSILTQLNKAILYLGTRSDVEGGNNQLNKEAALAFKTRVALYEGTWQKYHAGTPFATEGANPNKYFQACISAAEELMSGKYEVGIFSNGQPENDYYKLFGLTDMSDVNEVLFYKAYNSNDGLGHDLQLWLTDATNHMGLTWELVSSYLGKDGFPYDYKGLATSSKGNAFLTQIADDCDPRLKSTIWIPGDLRVASSSAIFVKPGIDKTGTYICPTGFQVKKFSDPYASSAGQQFGGYSETGYIYFRYAEVLLNYAEAKYELDGSIAYEQLNMLRDRVGMPDFTINPQSSDPNLVNYGYPISDALYEIRRERRVEMALEGKRSFDYHRWAAHSLFAGQRLKGYPFDGNEFPDYNPPTDEIGRIDYMKNSLPNGYQFRPGQDYLSSIPEEEIILNPNLIQNPGW